MDQDVGMLVLRLALGPMLVLHGWNKVGGAGGLAGTARWFDGLGLRPAWLHARAAAATEITAGVLVTCGLLTGFSAAAFVGLMLVAARTDHRGKGFFVFKGGWEYVALVALAAITLASVGPGEWSLDDALGMDLSGVGWAAFAAGAGLVAGGGLLASAYRPGTSAADRAASVEGSRSR
jgi:putative oxidoreductase